jgi:hypothetical protein
MLIIIAAAAIVGSPPVSSSVQGRAFLRVEHAAVISAEEWTRARPDLKRRERIIKDERGEPQFQRLVEFE